MEVVFKIGKPLELSNTILEEFLALLMKQNQVLDPNLTKIKSSKLLCIAYWDNNPIGIGAIKQVYNTPFAKAGLHELAEIFDYELGYLYILQDDLYRGIGLGKVICRLLLKSLGNENIFATTEDNDLNPMKHILTSLEFQKSGQTYLGSKTEKQIALFLKSKK